MADYRLLSAAKLGRLLDKLNRLNYDSKTINRIESEIDSGAYASDEAEYFYECLCKRIKELEVERDDLAKALVGKRDEEDRMNIDSDKLLELLKGMASTYQAREGIMDLNEIVYKLTGDIHPAGDSSVDDKHFENLKAITALVDDIIAEVEIVARLKDSHEYSVKRAGEYADKWLSWIRDNDED